MDFNYTEAQNTIRKMARRFAETEVAPGAPERDRTQEYDWSLHKRQGELGFMGMIFPKELGGSDVGFLAFCLAVEEVSRADLSVAVGPGATALAALQIWELGTDAQKEVWKDEYVIPAIKGDKYIAAAITEPGAGSDVSGIRTTAVLDGDEWVINGSKAFISGAGLPQNACTLVVCWTDKAKGEMSTILVPRGTPGYIVGAKYHKMGARSFDTRELVFDNCRVPAFNLLGRRGGGRADINQGLLAKARIANATSGLAVGMAAYDKALAYAQQRVAFKRTISQFQFIQQMLVDSALNIELGRMIRDRAALAVDAGATDIKLSGMAKYFCNESAKHICDWALQIHGSLGYMDECDVSRYYRDIRFMTIADGSTEIQKWILARAIGC